MFHASKPSLWFKVSPDGSESELKRLSAQRRSFAVVMNPSEPQKPDGHSRSKLMLIPYNPDDPKAEETVRQKAEILAEQSGYLPLPTPTPTPTQTQKPKLIVYNTGSAGLSSVQVPGCTPAPEPVYAQSSSSSSSSSSLNNPQQPEPSPNDNDPEGGPPPGQGNDGADNEAGGVAGDEEDRVRPVILYFEANDGDGGDPEDPDGTGTEQLTPDKKEKEFKKLEEQVRKVRPWQFMAKWRIISKLIRFARYNHRYAVRCYHLMERLIRWESLAVNIVVKVAFNEAIALSAFEDDRKATLRTGLVVTGDSLASLVPWFFPDKAWLEYLSVLSGSLLISGTDNAFSHWTNNSYAIPWLSNDFVNFEMRLFFLMNMNVWVSKHIYSGLLVGGAAKLTHGHLGPLLLTDFIIKPFWLYVSVAMMIGSIPVISITCAPSPIGPYHFPVPDYCPSIPWVPWLAGCNASNYSTEFGEIVDEECSAAAPAGESECNCSMNVELRTLPERLGCDAKQ